jgi:hypothetical protein
MGLKVTNNAFGTLNAGINSSATTIVLTAGQGARFPTLSAGDYFYATLIDTSNNLEIVKVTARSTDTMTVVRGQDNTTARAYSTNDRFELRPTAALFNEKANANEYLPLTGGTLSGPLAVENSSGTHLVTRFIQNNSSYNTDIKLEHVSVSGDTTLLTKRANGDLWLYNTSTRTVEIHTGGTQRVVVDSSGRVMMPYQPAFCAHENGSSAYANNSTIVFETVKFNTGSHYSNSTGRFTAPVAGKYLFYTQFLGEQSANTRTIAYLSLNGSQGSSDQTVEISATTKDYNSAQATTIMNLAAGDYVSVITSGTNHPYAGSSFQNIFCGHLVG